MCFLFEFELDVCGEEDLLCFSPPEETGNGFECSSVMYYYNEQECILNTETRDSQPDLFIPEGEGFKVDYFDMDCGDEPETCPTGSPTAVKSEAMVLTGADPITTESGTEAECLELLVVDTVRCRVATPG